MSKTQVLYFYKGTAFPIPGTKEEYEKIVTLSNNMCVKGLKTGISLNDQAKDYVNQLDKISNELINICGTNEITYSMLEKVSEKCGMSVDKCFALWRLNIVALLKFKKIKNDNNNGILFNEEL